jgi:CHAT domain-containing protein/Tfp pilus assembly protein PilF
MKNLIIKSLIIFVILNSSIVIGYSQSWKELIDSSRSYQTKKEFKTAMEWANKALSLAEKEYGKLDTNYAESLYLLADLNDDLQNDEKAVELGRLALETYKNCCKSENIRMADICSSLAYWYGKLQNFEKEEQYYKEKLAISRRLFKDDNPVIADIASLMTYFYWSLYKYDSALVYARLDSSIRAKTQGKENSSYVITALNLGAQYKGLLIYDLAEKSFKESLEISRRLNKTDNSNLATIIRTLGLFYLDKGDYQQAEPLLKEILDMTRRLNKDDNRELANNIGNLALLYHTVGDNKQAEPLYKEALEMNRRIYKSDNAELAHSINNMAGFYNRRGDLKEAESLYIEALEMSRRLYKQDDPRLASSINYMGYFYSLIGDFKKTEALYKEALAMRKRIYKGDNSELAESINNMSYVYKCIGDLKQAIVLMKESLEMNRRIFKSDHPQLAQAINNLATFYLDIKDYKQAEPLYNEALSMYRRLFKGDHQDLPMVMNNIAYFYKAKGDYKEAESLLKEALEMRRRIYKGDHSNLILSINNLANFFNDMGNYKEAEALLIESLESSRRIFKDDNPELARSNNYLASFYEETGDYTKAEPLYIEGLDIYKNILNNYFPSLSEKEKKLFWKTVSYSFESFNSFGVNRFPENQLITCNMYDMQLYSKALLFNSTSKIKKRIVNSNDLDLIEKYKEFTDKKELLVKLYSMSDKARKKRGFNTDSIEKITNELEKELSLKSELYAQSYDKKKITWKSIQTLLKPDEAAVEVLRFRYDLKGRITDSIYYAFLIVNDQTEEHPDIVVLENGKELENEYYTNYRMKINAKIEDKLSYSRYWEKLDDKLKGYKKIYFSADGIYNKLNPATLLMPNGKYLLDEQDIQQVNSTKDLLMGYYKSQQESNIYNSAVLIGNPNFALSESLVREGTKKMRGQIDKDYNYELLASSRGVELSKLPGTEKEIKDIEKFLKSKKWDVNSYLGDMALKTAVKSANSPRILHIATHGMFLEEVNLGNKETLGFDTQKVVDNPLLRSGLFFTGADNYIKSDSAKPAGDENGLLTAYEAMNLDLDKTELVVLSACETGLGDIKNGEGVFGLRRAFQQAGAKTVIMSLWAVNDDATQKLMSSFYSNWVTGMTKREAFSNAQQEVRKQFPEPYYWGAFVMVGE